MKITRIQPDQFVPRSPAEFIGPAADMAAVLHAKANSMRDRREGNLRYVITGEPGIGKTRLAEFLAAQLTGEQIVKGQSLHVESVNGRNVDLPVIRRWQTETRYVSTCWVVRIINELDTCAPASRDLLLTYLDELAERVAFIGTSNSKLGDLDERFQTRLQSWPVAKPETKAVAGLLKRFGMTADDIGKITTACGGNVRAALLDAQSILDARLV